MPPATSHAGRPPLSRVLGMVFALFAMVPAPGYADALKDGLAALARKDYQAAQQQLTIATTAPDADADAWYHLGLAEWGAGAAAPAVTDFQRALELEPHSPFAHQYRTNLGWAAIHAGQTPLGVGALETVAKARPDNAAALTNIAHALFLHAEDFNAAELWYARLVEALSARPPEQARAKGWLRETRQLSTRTKIGTGFETFRGDIVGGEMEGRTYGPAPNDNVILFRTLAGETITIRKSQIRSVATEPRYQGMGRAVRKGNTGRAPHTFGVISAATHVETAQALLNAGRAADAEPQFRLAVRKNPTNARARFGRAVALYRLKRYPSAATAFEATLRDTETAAQAHYYLVSIYGTHLRKPATALGHALAYLQLPGARAQAKAIEGAALKITQQLIAQHRGQPEAQWTRAAGLRLDQGTHRRVLGQAFLEANALGPALRHLGAAVEMGTGAEATRATRALETCVSRLEAANQVTPSVTYYRGYLHFTAGRLNQAANSLSGAQTDPRARTLLALIHAHRQEVAKAHALVATVKRAELPAPSHAVYDLVTGILEAPAWYGREQTRGAANGAQLTQVGAINGLGVYDDTLEGDLMPIIIAAKKNGRGQIEVNGNPTFDLFSIISFKEAFDWVENEIDLSYPELWDTTITFGGLSLYMAKGGDSAGCAMALALCSAVTGQAILQDVAITGAIRLDGRVEPVGEVPAKVFAAVTREVRTVIVPAANAEELGITDPVLYSHVKFVTVSTIAEARFHAFGAGDPETAEAFANAERRFRAGCRYYQLGAYALARPELEAVVKATPENYSAAKLLDAIGNATSGPVQPGALSG